MPVIFSFFITRDLHSKGAAQPNQTDSDVTCSRSCVKGKSQKGLKDN